jgi:hypothetical protein
MNTPAWTHDEIFSLIDHVIREQHKKNWCISSWDAVWAVVGDKEAQSVIDAALRKRGRKIPKGRLNADQRVCVVLIRWELAVNMVAWFNARWTLHNLPYQPTFDRIGEPGDYWFTS